MKTRLLFLTSAALGLVFLLLASAAQQSNAAQRTGSTYVSGGIYTDTTWTAAKSPYIVTGTVVVFPGCTLTVEPGVQVRFDRSQSLIVRGALIAHGAASNPIVFTSNNARPYSSSWGGISISGDLGGRASLQFVRISYASTGVSGGPLDLEDSVLYENYTGLNVYADQASSVARSIFEYNTYAVQAWNIRVASSIFRDNYSGFTSWGNASILGSSFIRNTLAVSGRDVQVQYCTLTDNDQALYTGTAFTMTGNTISGNRVGVTLQQPNAHVRDNNIYDNRAYNIANTGASNQEASGNWWGTTDTRAIDASIYDGWDNIQLGLVNYRPFLESEVTGAFSLTIEGRLEGALFAAYTFTGTLTAGVITTPVIYTWHATDQSPVVRLAGPTDAITFTWDRPGVKTIALMATSAVTAPVALTRTIRITGSTVYFPIVLNRREPPVVTWTVTPRVSPTATRWASPTATPTSHATRTPFVVQAPLQTAAPGPKGTPVPVKP